jgi:hypothetical protein
MDQYQQQYGGQQQPQQPQSVFNNLNQFGGQQPLPNATTILILGICSLVLCMICGIIGLVMANKEMKLYNANPNAYTPASLSNVKIGKILSIISIIIYGLFIIGYIIFIAVIASAAASGSFR